MPTRIILLLFFMIPAVISAQRTISRGDAKKSDPIRAQVWLYHPDASSTEAHFRFSSADLTYNKAETPEFSASIQVTYRAWTLDQVRQVADSGSVIFSDENPQRRVKDIYGKVKLNLKDGENYHIRIYITDRKKNLSSEINLTANKKDSDTKQRFLILQNEQVSCSPYLQSRNVTVRSEVNKNNSFFVRVYNRSFSLAPPPFSEYRIQQFKYEADSIYTLRFDATGLARLQLPDVGFVHIVKDTANKSGLTIFRFADHFPNVRTPDALIDPLRFICSSDEFKLMKNATDKKKAVDRFWLDRSGSKERARELIRNYYSRVEDANRKYSSYTEGWKTDRGMILMIFGEPASVDKTADSETWVYGDRFSSSSLRFNFIRVENPFSENDYSLQRMSVYKPEWYKAVDTWRGGRVYYFLN